MHIRFITILLVVNLCRSCGDFVYNDFEDFTSLAFNGAARLSCVPPNCFAKATKCNSRIEDVHKEKTRGKDSNQLQTFYKDEHGAFVREKITTYKTNQEDDETNINLSSIAGFGHREITKTDLADTNCATRLRLTPSVSSTVGSVWYNEPLHVLKGFVTKFSFQITEQSKVCTQHVHEFTSVELFNTCTVHGGDGFAFVIQLDKNGSQAIGMDGNELGYGGITNSIAVEFDTWTNVLTQGSNDVFHDHISIHSMSFRENTSGQTSELGHARPVSLADGKTHDIMIRYVPYVDVKYFYELTANENLYPFIKDNGQGRRLGTLAVFIDDGIKSDKPLFAIPINLSLLLDLPQSLAYVGFTGSTGKRWETHDIINWSWCDTGDCIGDPNEIERMEVADDSHLPPIESYISASKKMKGYT